MPKYMTQKEMDNFITNEHEFVAFVQLNEWVHRDMLGIHKIESNGLFPDFHAMCFNSEDKIKVEVEFEAINFKRHNHYSGGCHLILSLIRKCEEPTCSGLPVWSFYKWNAYTGFYEWCLESDQQFNSEEFNQNAM